MDSLDLSVGVPNGFQNPLHLSQAKDHPELFETIKIVQRLLIYVLAHG
jgi:hypothetical protein